MEELEIVSEQGTNTFTREELCKISADAISSFFDDAPEDMSSQTIATLKMALTIYSAMLIGKLLKNKE